jgi:hypothetical protein
MPSIKLSAGDNFENLKKSQYTGDKEFMLAAIRVNYKSLQFISNELKNDMKFLLNSIKENYKSLEYIPENFIIDDNFIIKAKGVMDAYTLIDNSPLSLIDNQDFLIKALRINYFALRRVFAKSEKFKNDGDFFIQAVKKKLMDTY